MISNVTKGLSLRRSTTIHVKVEKETKSTRVNIIKHLSLCVKKFSTVTSLVFGRWYYFVDMWWLGEKFFDI